MAQTTDNVVDSNCKRYIQFQSVCSKVRKEEKKEKIKKKKNKKKKKKQKKKRRNKHRCR